MKYTMAYLCNNNWRFATGINQGKVHSLIEANITHPRVIKVKLHIIRYALKSYRAQRKKYKQNIQSKIFSI